MILKKDSAIYSLTDKIHIDAFLASGWVIVEEQTEIDDSEKKPITEQTGIDQKFEVRTTKKQAQGE